MDGGTPNFKKWNILYPVYINSKKTIAEGRRISSTKACENPTALEIGDCCGHLKTPFAIELMVRVAELVPRHPGRTKKQEPAAPSSNVVPTKSGKGGKKKR